MPRTLLSLFGLAGLAVCSIAADRQFDLVAKMQNSLESVFPGAKARVDGGATVAGKVPVVRIIAPKPSSQRFDLMLPGRTAPIEQARLSGRATGVVVERHGEIGDRVKAGDILVVIDAPEVRQQLDRAKAAVEQVKARLLLAQLTFERAQELVPKKFMPEQARDDREANVSIAKADLDAAIAEVRRLEEVQGFQTVRAPFDGVILERHVERGDRVTGDLGAAGTFFYNVARLEQLRIEIDVPQSSALKVRPGTPAKVTFAEIPGQQYEARVVRSSQSIDQTSGTMRAELVMENPDLFLPAGLSGQVVLDVERDTACVLVPENALFVRQGQQYSAIVDNSNTIAFRRVQFSRNLGREAEICSGLAVSDRVIPSPNALLKMGDKVEIMKPVR